MINFLPFKSFRFLIIPIAIVLTACTSKPREVYASIPLVSINEAKPNQIKLPDDFATALSDPASKQLTHGKYDVTLLPFYVSALGHRCRQLVFSEGNAHAKRRIACEITYKENDNLVRSWFLENAIIEADENLDL